MNEELANIANQQEELEKLKTGSAASSGQIDQDNVAATEPVVEQE